MNITILISSVGRRSQLVECVRDSARALGFTPRVLGIDCSDSAPAAHLVDRFFGVPRCTDPAFLTTVLSICQTNRVDVLIPTIDTELGFYSVHRDNFLAVGTTVAISSPETVEICSDKVLTQRWLVENNFPTVRQLSAEQFLADCRGWEFPLIVKPRRGSASNGVARVHSRELLQELCKGRHDMIVQEIANGHEHTVNVLVDKQGRCICAVPHRRIEVRAGEVSKGVTVKDANLMGLASRIAERLPGAYGALNVQIFCGSDGMMQVTEINARFGGGYPLAHRAGADFPRWILEEKLQLPSSAVSDAWQDGLTMLRFDNAVFIPKGGMSEGNHA